MPGPKHSYASLKKKDNNNLVFGLQRYAFQKPFNWLPLYRGAAAREPLSEAQLQELGGAGLVAVGGLLGAVPALPGPGVLFERRDHRVQLLHATLAEYLADPARPPRAGP